MASGLSGLLIMAIIFATALPAARPARIEPAIVVAQNQTALQQPLADSGDLQSRLEAIERSMEAMRKDLGVPGLSLVIVKDDQVIYLKGFGRRDLERDLPVTGDTLFPIGSTTKAFTSMAALISADRGKLSLDDSPKRFLPYFKLRDRKADLQSTLRDLLTHRTGLKSYSDLAAVTGVLNRQELIQVIGLAKPTARFREKFQYNNIMFSAAGEAVARANHTSWEQLIEEVIFKPLGMKDTNTSISEMQKSGDFSRGYSADGENHALRFRDLSAIAPAGGINSNANELAHWLRLMLNRGVFNGTRLVSAKSFAQLWSPQIHVRDEVDYGLGWVLADWKGLRLALHNGGIDGFHSLIEMVPDRNVGFALLANAEVPSLDAEARRIVWTYLLDIKLESSSPVATDGGTGVNLDELVAAYRDPADGATAEIKIKDGKAVLMMTGQPPYTLVPKSIDEFRAVELPASYSLRIKRDPSGKVASIVLVEPEGMTELKRYDGPRAKPFTAPMSIKKLMQHMVAAAGGEANLRKHRTMLASITLDFENQGVTGSGVVSASAPNSQAFELTLTALGKTIGTAREYFDGRQGGEESSFDEPENWDDIELENKKFEADFHNQLLDWSTLFKSVKIVKMSKIGVQPVFVIEKTAASGATVIDYVSSRSFDLLRRETIAGPDSDLVTETFSDFRIVDGVRVPFRTLQQSEQFGDVTIRIKKLRFNVNFAANVFHAQGNGKSSQFP